MIPLWSNMIHLTPKLDNLKDKINTDFLYLYHEQEGNGRHHALEIALDCPTDSFQTLVPTILLSGTVLILPPQEENQWKELLQNWIHGSLSIWFQNEKQKPRWVICTYLEHWNTQQMIDLSRFLYQAFDKLQWNSSLGEPSMKQIHWIGVLDPKVQLPFELNQWTRPIDIPKMILPRWEDCFRIFQEQWATLQKQDSLLQNRTLSMKIYVNRVQFSINKSKLLCQIYFPLNLNYFSWRQFWNELQIVTYFLFLPQKSISWRLFTSEIIFSNK